MKLLRLLRHAWFDDRDARRVLGDEALARLADRVRASEARHGGEIRVCVEAALPFSYVRKDLGARQRALTLFGKLRVWDTEANNGVLIYLLLADHAIEIVADRGIARRVPQSEWDALVATMRSEFAAGRFEEGLARAIDAVDALLVQHFPRAPGAAKANELPDDVVLP